MNNSDFNTLLKSVSRSFYLSIRILPSAMQQPVAVAYLLARAADAIADTAILPEADRLNALLQFKELLINGETTSPQSVTALIGTIDHTGERELLEQLPAILALYNALTENDFNAVKKVVNTLTTGMEKDLNYFDVSEQIRALPDDDALDDYTYYVAGCVGEFWTALSLIHSPSLSHWNKEKQITLGIRFGKALQLSNILRDISKDAKLGRCYLPASDLAQHTLNANMLNNEKNIVNFKPVVDKWLDKADEHFDAAQTYLLSIPRTCLRLRLASLWPILIGLATLKLIKNNADEKNDAKVTRKWIYKMLVLSIPAAFSNTLLRYWIKKIRHDAVS